MNLLDVLKNKYTLQEIFDFTLAKIREQGKASSFKFGEEPKHSCRYRGTDGAKCAFGHLIPDEEYNPEFEDVPIYAIVEHLYPRITIDHDLLDLLEGMQRAHDEAAHRSVRHPAHDGDFLNYFEEHMSVLADLLDLNYTPPS